MGIGSLPQVGQQILPAGMNSGSVLCISVAAYECAPCESVCVRRVCVCVVLTKTWNEQLELACLGEIDPPLLGCDMWTADMGAEGMALGRATRTPLRERGAARFKQLAWWMQADGFLEAY